jgi:hypothetical protein
MTSTRSWSAKTLRDSRRLAADSAGSSFWTCSATASSVRASFTRTSGSASARCNCINARGGRLWQTGSHGRVAGEGESAFSDGFRDGLEIGAGTSALSFAPRLGQIVPLVHCSCSDAIKSRCKGERRSSRLSEHLSVGTRAHWRRFAPTILPPASSRPSWRDLASTPH